MYREVSQLLLYSNLGEDSILRQLSGIFSDWAHGECEKPVLVSRIYQQVKRLLDLATRYGFNCNLWHDYLTFVLMGATKRGLYEPIHGSAPDIAGQNKANPIATILSAAMMLRYAFDMADEADCIERAVDAALNDGLRTADIVGQSDIQPLTCTEMTDAILARL